MINVKGKNERESFDLKEKINYIKSNIEDMSLMLENLSNKFANICSDIKELEENINNEEYLDEEETFIKLDKYGTISIVNHPTIDKLKMLVVFDNLNSEEVMNELKEELENWFMNLDNDVTSNYDLLYASYVNQIAEIVLQNSELSLSSALLDDNKTMAVTYGNKSIYSCANGEIFELKLPVSVNYSFINSTIMGNDEYTTIMLLSDGDKEEIEDNNVKIITKKTNRDALAEELLESVQEEK